MREAEENISEEEISEEGQAVSEEYVGPITEMLSEKIKSVASLNKLVQQLLKGAEEGYERELPGSWLERFKFHFLWLDKDDYSRALVRALWLSPRFAGTDFGTSRQRDMGQVWTDTARGFLGEIALSKFLKQKFNLETKIDTTRGELKDFLPTDVAAIRFGEGEWRKPKLLISLKATKFNGRWLDLPGNQYDHSDIFVLVRIGILQHHFLAFLKAISFLKDKLFVAAKNLGELDDANAALLWDEIPVFEPIPAYIVGFLRKSEVNFPIHSIGVRVKGRKSKKLVISQGVGLFSPETVRTADKVKALDPEGKMSIEIEPIIKSLASSHFFAHSGALKFGQEEWTNITKSL